MKDFFKKYQAINYLSLVIIFCCVAIWAVLVPKVFLTQDETLANSNNFGNEENLNEKDLKILAAGKAGAATSNIQNQTLTNDEIASALIEKKFQENQKENLKNQRNQPITFAQLLEPNPKLPVKQENCRDFLPHAASSVAIDVETGTILHENQSKKRMAIASLTKMMTAILVVEKIPNLDKEIVTIDSEALMAEGTVVGCPRTGYCIDNRLRLGEKIKARDLLEAMLMNSTNDAAIALGKHIAGSQKKFAEMMNAKAKEIGLTDTNFCNPSGLDEDDRPGQCYSSAYDIAMISAYSMRYEAIWRQMKLKERTFISESGISHRIINTDLLLDKMANCVGGKTGFTYEAGKSLMLAAHNPTDKKKKVVAVLLNGGDYRWTDMESMMSWVFKSYKWPGF